MEVTKNSTKKAIERLAKELNLPISKGFMQDWEYEVSDASRVEDFIKFYQTQTLDDDEKITLMILIINSYNEAFENCDFSKSLWNEVKKILVEEKDIHISTIEYWSCVEDNIEDCFCITPLFRSIEEHLNSE